MKITNNVEIYHKHRKNMLFLHFSCKNKKIFQVCNQYFKYESGLKKHKLRHKPPGGFICSECQARFVTDAERLLHKEVVHKVSQLIKLSQIMSF